MKKSVRFLEGTPRQKTQTPLHTAKPETQLENAKAIQRNAKEMKGESMDHGRREKTCASIFC